MRLRRRKTEKALRTNGFSAPFDGLAEPPSADYRGIPSAVCPCGSSWFAIITRFDTVERIPGMYLLDARCACCGAWVTAPTPIDDNYLTDWEGRPE